MMKRILAAFGLLVLPSCVAALQAARPAAPSLAQPIPAPPAQTSTHAIIRPSPQESVAVIKPHVLPPAVTPGPGVRVIPPEEFDHPFEGRLVIERSASQAEIRARCAPSAFPLHLGCARRTADGGCSILMADDETIAKLGYTVEIVFRHERAHCLGWPAHHPGAR